MQHYSSWKYISGDQLFVICDEFKSQLQSASYNFKYFWDDTSDSDKLSVEIVLNT